MLFPDVVSLPVTDSVPRTSSAVFCVIVPETTKLLNPLVASRVATLADVPDILTVLVPRANVEPAPDVSHCPLTVQDPLVRVSVPDAPPVNVTSTTATLAAFAVRIPELPTARDPPVKRDSMSAAWSSIPRNPGLGGVRSSARRSPPSRRRLSHCPLRTGMSHRGIRRLRDSQKSTFAKRGNRRSRRRFLRPSSSRCCC